MAIIKPSERFSTHKIGSSSDPTKPIGKNDLVIIESVDETAYPNADDRVRVGMAEDLLIDQNVPAGVDQLKAQIQLWIASPRGTDFTYDVNGNLKSGTVIYPDGSTGSITGITYGDYGLIEAIFSIHGVPVTVTITYDESGKATSINYSAGSYQSSLEAPVAAEANDVLRLSFTATWAAAEGAASYRLDVSTSSGFETKVKGYDNLAVIGTSQAVDTGLLPNTKYYYRVRAVDSEATVSANSNTITVELEAFQPESMDYFSAVETNGGSIYSYIMVDDRIKYLKGTTNDASDTLWSVLKAEYSPCYGVKTELDSNDRVVITRLYNLKTGGYAAGVTDSDYATCPELVTDETLGLPVIAAGKYPRRRALTYLNPGGKGFLRNKSSAYMSAVLKLGERTNNQMIMFWSTDTPGLVTRAQITKRESDHATEPNEYYLLARRENEATGSSVGTQTAFTNESWKSISGLVNYQARTLDVYVDGVDDGENEVINFGAGAANSEDTDSAGTGLLAAGIGTVTYAYGLIALLSLFARDTADTTPVLSSANIASNQAWLEDNLNLEA